MRRQLAALAVLQVLDLWTTWQGLGLGAHERNPVGQALLGHGFAGLVVAKLVGMAAVVCIAVVLWRSPATRWQAVAGLQVGCFFMVTVVGWNSFVGLLQW